MEKIVINGTADREKILSRFKSSDVQIYFDVISDGMKTCNEYSAVFFTGDYSQCSIAGWVGNEHLRIAENEAELIKEIEFFLGIPEPLEIERKFLVEYPDADMLDNLENCAFVYISQCYTSDENGTFRVRKRGRDGEYIYIRTEKHKISEVVRLETERRISASDYDAAVKGEKVLSKRRYLFIYKNKYFELDIFPFWQDRALLEIELKDENEVFELPSFLKVIKEVTANPCYKNSNIAAKFGTVNAHSLNSMEINL